MKRALWAVALAVGLVVGLGASGRTEQPPTPALGTQPPAFVAPSNPEASQRSLVVPFAPQAAPDQVLKSWTFSVYDATGALVWVTSRTETKDRGFFGELFNLGPRPQVEVPSQLAWDGTFQAPGRSDNGGPVPNGVYSYVISVTDSLGKTASSAPYSVSIQNSPIQILQLAVDHPIFSPAGQRSTVTIRQDGSREARWEGTILDATGAAVRTFTWANPGSLPSEDPVPPTFTWDGRDGAGKVLADGEYRYRLRGTNRAGASATRDLDHALVISSRPGILRLTADRPVFSPAADEGWPTVLVLRPDSGDAKGLVGWSVSVTDADHPKVALWTKSGKGSLPETVVFEGKDQVGRPLADGPYRAVLSADFDNGNASVSPVLSFDVDTAAPQGTLKAPAVVFGGTGRTVLPVEFVGTGNLAWSLDLVSADGKVLKTTPLGSTGQARVDLGAPEPGVQALTDGTYRLVATTHDQAGNRGQASLEVTRDSRPRSVVLTASSPVLVPGNSVNGTITVSASAAPSDGLSTGAWVLTGPTGATLDRKAFSGPVPDYLWSAAGSRPPADGAYRLGLEVTWANGTVVTAQKDLKVDATYLREPQGSLTLSAPLFGGSGRPSVTVGFRGDPGIAWTLELADGSGKVLATQPLGSTGTATADLPLPKDQNLADGTYSLRARAVSAAGVPGAVAATVTKDSRVRKVSLDLSRSVLVPGKGANAQVRVTPVLESLEGVASTEITVQDGNGAPVARQSKDGILTFWDWDGKALGGTVPADGAYQVTLAVTYANGGVFRSTADLRVDSAYLTEPQGSLTVSAAAFGSRSRPTVTAQFTGDPATLWSLDVVDKAGKVLKTDLLGDSGQGQAEIGLDAAGKALPDGTYLLRAWAKNRAGLMGTVTTEVRKDSRPRPLSLDVSTPVLVPGNVLNGTIKVTPVLSVLDSIDATDLTLTGPDGKALDTKSWTGLVPFWDWDGKDSLGKVRPDGTYRVALRVTWANGDVVQATRDFRVDSSYLKEPQGTLTASAPVFGGSGRAGVTIDFQGDAGLPWVLEILGQDGRPVRKETLGTGGTARFDFQGIDDKGQALPDGPYTLRASATSPAGVPGTVLLQLRKDSRQAKAGLDFSRTVLVPGKGPNGTVRITPLLEAVDSLTRTVVSVLGPGGRVVAEKSVDGTLPFWDWTGTDAQGTKLANGTYQVVLTASYENGSTARAQGELKVDSTYLNDQGPLVEMALSTKTFAPNNVDGATDLTVSIKTTEGVVPVEGWQLAVLDPRGKVFRQWSGKGLPPKSLYWDGKGEGGDTVESGEDYQLQLKVSDTQGHVTRKQDSVTIDISVVKIGEGKYKIVVSSIQFAGNSDDVFKVQNDLLTKNLFVLRRLAAALGKFPGYKIRLEGYAVSEYWNDPKTADWEQKTQLLPLSLGRAQAVRNVMVLLGIDADRFTVQGFGGERPLVPNADLENRWKNRRVEFYLDKS